MAYIIYLAIIRMSLYSKFLTSYKHVILYNLYNLCILTKSKPEINDPVSQVI